jgi:hypothetical protein
VKILRKKLAVLFFLLFIILFFCTLNGQMYGDEGIWSYMGRIWAENSIRPYSQALDDKPIGIFWLNSISHEMFGVNFFFERMLGVLAIIITSCFLYKINKNLFGSSSGIFALVTYSMAAVWKDTNGSVTGFSEVFMVCFSTIGFFWIMESLRTNNEKLSNLVLAGLAFGIAVSFKQVAGLSLLAALLSYTLIKYKKIELLIWDNIFIITCFLASFFILHLPLLSPDVLENYAKYAWLNPRYYETVFWRLPKFFEAFFSSRMVLFYPFLLFLLIFLGRFRSNLLLKSICTWLVLAFIGVSISGYYGGHQITQLLPSLSLLIGISIAILVQKFSLDRTKTLLIIIILFFPFNVVTHNAASILSSKHNFHSSVINHIVGNSKLKELGLWIRKHTEKEDYIFIYGKGPNVTLAYSNCLSASPYINNMRFVDSSIPEKVAKDLNQKKPKFILEGALKSNYQIIDKIINKNYHKIDNKIVPNNVILYLRNKAILN